MTPKGSRKRVKPSPSGVDSPFPASPSNAAPARSESLSQERLVGSWYPGSWSAISRGSKAAPVTEVARESISVAQNVACSVADSSNSSLHSPKRNLAQSIQLIKKAGASTRSLPADVATTRVNIASDGSASTTAQADSEPNPAEESPAPADKPTPFEVSTKNSEKSAEEQEPTVDGDPDSTTSHPEETSAAEQASGWFSWLYKPGNTEKSTVQGAELETSTDRTSDTPENSNKAADLETNKPQSAEQDQQSEQDKEPEEYAQGPSTTEITSTAQKRSWLQMWYGSPSSKPEEQSASEPARLPTETEPSATADVEMAPNELPEGHGEDARPPQAAVDPVKSSGWSFWAKDTSKDGVSLKPQEVEVVEGSIATNNTSRPPEIEPDIESNVKITPKGSLRVKPPKNSAVSTVEAISTSTPPAEPRPVDAASKQLQKVVPNQVLPRFEETYSLEESPSLFQSLGRFLHYTKGPEHNHVSRVKEPPRIKRALAIGVHGYFPAPLIRTVLGQPTGTSIRFSNMAAESIRKYTADHGYSCEIEKIALEGEGRISERVDLLWKLLLNWMEEIRKADFILVACHSQGVPVSIMLVAKLISFGCVNASRVGVCAMAGVNMGPFSSYRSRWISGSAGELFEFEQPSSRVSKDYEAALKCALDFGVRISYIGSIDDQLVSLESSLFSPIDHPYIYRSVFVDGRVHAPSFVSHLVGFALKLRNLGIPDHGLIRELSTPLAGSLYTGDGHSRLYDDEAVYYMAIQFALETSIVPEASLQIKRSSPSVPSNPFILPFAMRGLLEEEHVRREMNEETMELLRQFDDWKPSSKVLKDVKFRLEGIRSKL